MTSELPPQLPLDSPAPNSSTFGTVAAASVMAECLRVQADVPPRGAVARRFGRSPLSDESRPWHVGALGELDVASRLDSLGDEWTVLNSAPIGTRGSDIDHVVVSAAGVFTINTKFHEDARVWVGSRRLLVNGQATDHLRNTRYEATRTQKLPIRCCRNGRSRRRSHRQRRRQADHHSRAARGHRRAGYRAAHPLAEEEEASTRCLIHNNDATVITDSGLVLAEFTLNPTQGSQRKNG